MCLVNLGDLCALVNLVKFGEDVCLMIFVILGDTCTLGDFN